MAYVDPKDHARLGIMNVKVLVALAAIWTVGRWLEGGHTTK